MINLMKPDNSMPPQPPTPSEPRLINEGTSPFILIPMLILLVGMMIALITLNGLSVSAVNVDIEGNEMIRSNVSDGLTYEYEITSIEGNEVHGIALNRVSYDNVGIFLYDDGLTFDVNEGDVIAVQYGEYKDEFISIELIQ